MTGNKKGWRLGLSSLLTAPYLMVCAFFLVFPLAALVKTSFQDGFGGWVRVMQNSTYFTALKQSLLLAVWTTAEASVAGAALALVWAQRLKRHGWFLAILNFAAHNGGISLAFAIMATLGTNGMLTILLKQVGIDLYPGFQLSSIQGLHWAYLSFLIPFMSMIFLPAAGALRHDWMEAASTLGAGRLQYAFRVAGPVLLPAYLSSTALVFLQALGTYATAQAISGDNVNLLTIQIGYLIQQSLFRHADALSFILLIIMVFVVLIYRSANRKAARWLE